jgi:ADP-ribose pyrophosphatase YjhB (NUDIX family)
MKKHLYFMLYYLALVYWFLFRPHENGAGVIVEYKGKILLVRHTYGHREQWHIPGGHKKSNEKPETTAARELQEELGLTLKLKLLGTAQAVEDYHYLSDTYFVGRYDQQQIMRDDVEIKEYEWWPKNELPSQLSASAIEGLRLYLAK